MPTCERTPLAKCNCQLLASLIHWSKVLSYISTITLRFVETTRLITPCKVFKMFRTIYLRKISSFSLMIFQQRANISLTRFKTMYHLLKHQTFTLFLIIPLLCQEVSLPLLPSPRAHRTLTDKSKSKPNYLLLFLVV